MTDRYSHISTDLENCNQSVEINSIFLELCDGDFLSARLLEIIEDRSNGGLVPVIISRREFTEALNGACSDTTVKRRLSALFEKGFIGAAYVSGIGTFYSTTNHLVTRVKMTRPDSRKAYAEKVPTRAKLTQQVCRMGTDSGQIDPSQKLDIVNNIYNINNIYSTSSSNDKLLPIKAEKVEDNSSTFLKSEDDNIFLMGLEQVKSVLRVYHLGGNKHKADMYKKSVATLAARFGEKVEQVIKTYGEDATIQGIRKFLEDEYWINNGLPLPAFLKAPERWIIENGSETRYNEPKKGPRVTGLRGKSTSPAPPDLQESLFPETRPMDNERLRAMRRNEGYVLLSSCKSVLLPEYMEATANPELSNEGLEEWFIRACDEFRAKMKIQPPVSTRPVFVKVEEAV